MDLGGNELAGEIPPLIGNLTSLNYFGLNENYFIGPMPSSLNILQIIDRLYLGLNDLQGNILMEIGKLKSIGVLSLTQNNLSRIILDFVAHLQQLRYLYID
jgi:hypothetical protein